MALGKGLSDVIHNIEDEKDYLKSAVEIGNTETDENNTTNIDVSDLKGVESITVNKLTKREKIPNKLTNTIDEIVGILSKLIPGEDISENDKVLQLMDYILSEIYFDKNKREEEFKKLKNNPNATEKEKTEFLERHSDMNISGEDWSKLLHVTGLYKWSMGEMGNEIEDRVDILRKISYYSLHATLRTGIHTGLFLQNIGKYFPNIKEDVFDEFKNNPEYSGGLALTGLGSGSNLLENVGVKYEKQADGNFKLEGTVRFQGLTNEGTHWILIAENKEKDKDFKVFMLDTTKKNQSFKMTKEYDMEMLDSITYGENEVDAIIPKENIADMKILRELPGMLNDSRLQFVSMIEGISQRVVDETRYKTELRVIAGGKMSENRIIQDRVNEIEIRNNIIKLLNEYVIYIGTDLSNRKNDIVLANIAKAISTDYVLENTRSAKILQGGDGFKSNNVISNIEKDAKPFSIFEGNNDMLYSQIVRKYKKTIDLKGEVSNIGINLEKIKDLEVNDSIKGQIYAIVNILSMISEMGLNGGYENKYENEIKFLIKEAKKLMINADNLQSLNSFDLNSIEI